MSRFLQHHPYPVTVGAVAPALSDWLGKHAFSAVFVLSDANTRRFCLPLLAEVLTPETIHFCLEPAPGQPVESLKTMDTAVRIWEAMLHEHLDRHALALNLGGGVVGDLGGFCAAVYKRGVRYAHVPTTLLAMTDAAIGGKLGVDFHGIKNVLGVVAPPAGVFVDPAFLQTLPPRELYSGFAEVIKHALIGHPDLWDELRAGVLPLAVAPEDWPRLLEASMQVKLRIVQEDPLEKGLRKLLNFGHTVGHALESWFLETPDPITHGEAVAMGMVAESFLQGSPRLGEIAACLHALYPRRTIPAWAYADIWARMRHDKKNTGGEVMIAVPGKKPFELEMLAVGEERVYAGLGYLGEWG